SDNPEGKRLRPTLCLLACEAVGGDPADALPVAVAIEFVHNFSLIHDDIEDADVLRYGEKTLHEEYGVPIALNVGDFLLGEGYRMITRCDVPEDRKADMLRIAAEGHRSLCLGQGAELLWMRKPTPLSTAQVIDIFRRKTSPAFEVALRLGAAYAGAEDDVGEVISGYSESLGIAYQVNDDLNDFANPDGPCEAVRPNVLLSIAGEGGDGGEDLQATFERIMADPCVETSARRLLELYKHEAIRRLNSLANANLKGLLRRVVGKIFDDFEIMFCCDDHKADNASGGESGAESAK
ncbi:MAG: polyprenyl synthetase family protein, partial [Phycisphaerae bacterium]|nr:polyprenyl synthetase family protein [Phycisphaerae bacterium]